MLADELELLKYDYIYNDSDDNIQIDYLRLYDIINLIIEGYSRDGKETQD